MLVFCVAYFLLSCPSPKRISLRPYPRSVLTTERKGIKDPEEALVSEEASRSPFRSPSTSRLSLTLSMPRILGVGGTFTNSGG